VELNNNIRGAGWMTLGSAGYVINDAFIKIAAEDLPLFEAIFIRGMFIAVLLFVIAVRRGQLANVREHLDRHVALRVTMEAIGTAFYLSALTRLPIAGLVAVIQIVPLIVTFIAARLLHEAVSWHRVLSVVIGFVGVLLVVRPGSSDFNPWFLAGLAVVITIVVREMATKRISTELPTMVISICTALAIASMGLLGSIVEGWDRPSAEQTIQLGAAAAFLSVGYIASVITIRVGDLSFSAPFRYTVLIFALVIQIVVFQDVPDALTFVGTGIIAAAGLYAFSKEQRIRTVKARPS
jgi:drug/metabolite transporter (DMT)-like permease